MFTDVFHNIAVFLYVHYTIIATIVIALIALNAIRKTMVARRRRNVQARRAAMKSKQFNTFDTI